MRLPGLLTLLLLAKMLPAVSGQAAAPAPDGLATATAAFFEKHCLDCHETGTTKGGLDLEKIDFTLREPAAIDAWIHIYDRIAKGEMPPAKKPRPAQAEVAAVLAAIQPRLVLADRGRREVVQRRLNRAEYEATVQQLLGIDIELTRFLTQDQTAGGFDTNGEALAISTEAMQGYVEAARAAIDAAIVTTPRPKEETWKTDALSEVQRYIDTGEFGFKDGRIVTYVTTGGDYSKISTRAKRTTVRGRYRVRFQAAAHLTEELGFFTVAASSNVTGAPAPRNLGYFEVGPEPKMFEIEAVLEAKSALQFFGRGLPGYVKSAPGTDHRGVGFGPAEITGPLIDQWPPESHTRLLGEVDLATGTLADAEKILRRFLPRAFRGPVTDEVVERYLAMVGKSLEAKRSFHESLRTALTAILCSPNFLYLAEQGGGETAHCTEVELASRLSYFLWSSMPDAELLEAGTKRELSKPAVLRAQTERMLRDPRAEALVRNFTGQWLRLRQINDTVPDKKFYPQFDDLLQMSMVREGEGFFRQMLQEDLPIADFLDSDWAMLNQRLAEHYGIEGVKGIELRKVKLPAESVRGGVLTQAGVLKVTANGTNTSPVMRGVWVLENILGEPVPPPPPNTGGIEPDIRGAVTIREQLAKHRSTASCMACHSRIDPPGFA
ncbi:MAG TPA: DUF1592 domain-containing protein, partial [Chthoniobacteraceae bacterium]|nr:DUF1592 domain-containing protein [Chthoniobacteraceae bacterium]